MAENVAEHKVDNYTDHSSNNTEGIDKKTKGTVDLRKNWDYLDRSTIAIG